MPTLVQIRYSLILIRQQAIIWNNNTLAQWRMYASLSLNGLKIGHQDTSPNNGHQENIHHCAVNEKIPGNDPETNCNSIQSTSVTKQLGSTRNI